MLMFKITRPATEKLSSKGSKYFVQKAVVQMKDRDGIDEEVPRVVEFMTDKGYPPGDYTLSDASFGVGQYDRFEIRRMLLVPSKGLAANPAPDRK